MEYICSKKDELSIGRKMILLRLSKKIELLKNPENIHLGAALKFLDNLIELALNTNGKIDAREVTKQFSNLLNCDLKEDLEDIIDLSPGWADGEGDVIINNGTFLT